MMKPDLPSAPATLPEIAAWILMGIGLVLILKLHLLPALLGGLLVYELVHILAPRLVLWRLGHDWSKLLAVGLLAMVVILILALAIVGIVAALRSEISSPSGLIKALAEIIDSARDTLPGWVVQNLPENAEELRLDLVAWLREHARDVQTIGKDTGRAIAHVLIGMIIGALISLREAKGGRQLQPLAQAFTGRTRRLGDSFRRVVFAQVRISALNTTLTTIYLAILLPLLGVHLPFLKTMIAVTFVAGLMPVIGNLFSNTVICIVSLSHSLNAALGSLLYLVIIHKLEYFANARIIGTQIRSRAWELLSAMLVMEAAFGVGGVIAAPIYYAYIKDELGSRGLI